MWPADSPTAYVCKNATSAPGQTVCCIYLYVCLLLHQYDLENDTLFILLEAPAAWIYAGRMTTPVVSVWLFHILWGKTPYNSLVRNAISFTVMHNAFLLNETSLFASFLIKRQRPDAYGAVVFCLQNFHTQNKFCLPYHQYYCFTLVLL